MADTSVEALVKREYDAGFVTDIESDTLPPGLDESVVRFISAKKKEPEWLTEWRLKAYRHWLEMPHPHWANVNFPPIDFQALSYYSAPKDSGDGPKSLDDVDPELLRTYEKLGIPLHEQEILAGVVKDRAPADGVEASANELEPSPEGDMWEPSPEGDRGLEAAPTEAAPTSAAPTSNVAVDAVFDSVSIATTFKDKLREAGVIFCSISEAVQEHPELVRKYLGSVVPAHDNFFAALNTAVYSDGSFVYVPEGVRCPMELSTYFRINAQNTGQFERTLIIAEKGAYVSYLEGCTAPMRDENQLHAAVVELVAMEDAQIKYSTVQNWYPGDAEGKGGIYNFVTKRGAALGDRAKISWTQVETGSAITWKYPSVVLRGNDTVGEFYSVALTNNYQQADTGTKMIHLGRNSRSTIISKGISAGHSNNSYRGLVRTSPTAAGARNYTQCDSLLIGTDSGAHTFPYIENRCATAMVEHEATTSKVSDEQLFLCQQRGIDPEKAVSMIVNGFCKDVFRELPMEFAVEAGKLLEVSLEGAVG